MAYFWRKPSNLVRFPWVDPRKDFETFCFHLLCEDLSFTSELFVTNGLTTFSAAAVAAGIIDTYDKLHDRIAAHCKYMFASSTLTEDDILMAYNHLFHDVHDVELAQTCDFHLDVERATAIRDEAADLLPDDLAFDESQTTAIQSILAPGARGIFIVRGGPGCGKSVIARYVAHQRALEDGVVLMAPTNEVAQRLSKHADALHSSVDIPTGTTLRRTAPHNKHLRTLATCHTIIIDEAFMVPAQNLQYVLTRLSEAQDATINHVLATNTILLVGDERQLPPICQANCKYLADVCNSHHLCTNIHFKDAWHTASRQLLLDVNHRNPAMAHKLARIAAQHQTPLTQEWVDEQLNDPFHTEHVPMDLESRMLCTHHVDADAHNAACVHAFAEAAGAHLQPLERLCARQIDDQPGLEPVLYEDLSSAEQAFLDHRGPDRAPHLCIGSPVRFNVTVAKNNGKTKAATGTVEGFHYDFGGDTVTAVQVFLDRTQTSVKVGRVRSGGRPPGGKYVQVSYWPLTPAYASTVHSVQGANISHTIRLNFRSCFDTGLAYTALSRNTTDGHLSLARRLTVHDLRVIDIHAYFAAKVSWLQGYGPGPKTRQRVHVEDLLH